MSSLATSTGSPANDRGVEMELAVEVSAGGSRGSRQATPVAVAVGTSALQDSPSSNVVAATAAAAAAAVPCASEQAATPGSFGQPAVALDGDSRFTKFWRCETGADLVEVHLPTRRLLYRQFLESLIRMALASFPNECGMEPQLRRLFKERLRPEQKKEQTEPAAENAFPARNVFGFFLDSDIRSTLDDLEPGLRALFRSSQYDTMSHVPQGNPTAANLPSLEALSSCRFGDFGASRRHMHVNARHDITTRLKDVLKLLDSMGFLRNLITLDLPGERVYEPLVPEPEPIVEMPVEDGGSVGSGSQAEDDDSSVEKVINYALRFLAGKQVLPRRKGEEAGGPIGPPDFADTDLQTTLQDVLRIASDVLSPEYRDRLRWQWNEEIGECPGDYVSLLEYAESELTYVEFVRLLVYIADDVTVRNHAVASRVSPAKRIDGFLRNIFLPALQNPYTPPEQRPIPSASPEPAASAHGSAFGSGEPVSPEPFSPEPVSAGPSSAVDASVAAEFVPNPASPVEYWRGFTHGRADATATRAAPRRWPAGYKAEVLAWK